MSFELFLPIIIGAVIVLAVVILLFSMIRTANGNEALVVSGVGATDKKGNPKIKRAGGRVVIPFIQKAKYFDLCVRTAKVEGDVTKTQTGVPIQIDWAVAYSPDISSDESLQRAVCNFLDKDDTELKRVILDVVSGGVRAVIAKMTPEEVMNGKDKLDDQVKESISAQMKDLGFNAILSIHEVEDASGSTYYKDLAAKDRETKRREAANITAENDQQIRETRAETDKAAQEKELAAQVTIAEKQRDNRQLEERKGAVAVTQAEQQNLAAKKQQEVEVTKAETAKRTTIINAEAEAGKKKAEAEGEAEAAATRKTREAQAAATARRTEAEGNAEARKTEATAEAEATKTQANADAEATKLKGEAEAAAIPRTKSAALDDGSGARAVRAVFLLFPCAARCFQSPRQQRYSHRTPSGGLFRG